MEYFILDLCPGWACSLRDKIMEYFILDLFPGRACSLRDEITPNSFPLMK
jgi:hypothetical protein